MSQNDTAKRPATGGNVIDVKVGDMLTVGDIKITVLKKHGQRALLRVVAHEDILISRPKTVFKPG